MPIQAFKQNIPSGTTLASTAVDLLAGARNVSVVIPTMASGTDILFKASYDDSTYFNVKFSPTSGVVAVGNVTIGSAVTQAVVRVPELAGQRYIKTELGTVMSATSANFYYIVEY